MLKAICVLCLQSMQKIRAMLMREEKVRTSLPPRMVIPTELEDSGESKGGVQCVNMSEHSSDTEEHTYVGRSIIETPIYAAPQQAPG
jgi:hypothetical protein